MYGIDSSSTTITSFREAPYPNVLKPGVGDALPRSRWHSMIITSHSSNPVFQAS
jgi:hypothetical protein